MSGMAGNVTAFNTVWTYDIYQSYIRPGADDAHYLWMGRMATVFGIAGRASARPMSPCRSTTSWTCCSWSSRSSTRRCSRPSCSACSGSGRPANGAFWGLLGGTGAAAVHYALTGVAGAHRLGWLHSYPSDMAQNFWGAIYAWTGCFVLTIAISFFTRRRDEKDLVGLVYSLTPKPSSAGLAWYRRPLVLGVIVLTASVALNVYFR